MTEVTEKITMTGSKMHMSQVFTPEGKVIPVTIVKVNGQMEDGMENREVVIVGRSKGKGFTGTIKKWGFARQPATRGQSDKERAPGSIGAQTPGRVFKGKKMAGKHGNKQITVKGLKVVRVDVENNQLMVSGPIPGARNSEVQIRVI